MSDVKLEPRNDSSGMIQSVVAVKHPEFPPPPATKKQRCRDYDGKAHPVIFVYFLILRKVIGNSPLSRSKIGGQIAEQ